MRYPVYILVVLFLSAIALSCQKEEKKEESPPLRVRLQAEPDRLNPNLSLSTQSTQIERFLYQSLFEFDPYTLEYVPVLAKEPPLVEEIMVDGQERMTFTYEIREEAKWDDGSDIDSEDYIFTLKSIFHPNVEAAKMRDYLGYIIDVTPDTENPKKFTVITNGVYFQMEEIVSFFYLLPQHVYDPENILGNYSFDQFVDAEAAVKLVEDNEDLQRFAIAFNGPEFSREVVNGSGPYSLTEWVTEQSITLRKKDNWWGNGLRDQNVLFKASPTEIQYKIIPDESVALAGLKDGSIHLISNISPQNYFGLKADSIYKDKFHFLEPIVMQYIHILLNTNGNKLDDKRVRQALAYLVDMEYIIDELFKGLATQTVGPVNPTKPYYNKQLSVRTLEPQKASGLLTEAGWSDSDGDGVRDKMKDGKKMDLKLKLMVSGAMGEQLGLVMKEEFEAVGVHLDIERKKFSLIREDMQKGEFDMVASALRQSPGLVDFYQSWHSDNAYAAGGNYSGFGTMVSDSLISQIRVTLDPEVRARLYMQIQEVIYEEQPSIFLVSPKGRVVVSKDWSCKEALVRPGFIEQDMKWEK